MPCFLTIINKVTNLVHLVSISAPLNYFKAGESWYCGGKGHPASSNFWWGKTLLHNGEGCYFKISPLGYDSVLIGNFTLSDKITGHHSVTSQNTIPHCYISTKRKALTKSMFHYKPYPNRTKYSLQARLSHKFSGYVPEWNTQLYNITEKGNTDPTRT